MSLFSVHLLYRVSDTRVIFRSDRNERLVSHRRMYRRNSRFHRNPLPYWTVSLKGTSPFPFPVEMEGWGASSDAANPSPSKHIFHRFNVFERKHLVFCIALISILSLYLVCSDESNVLYDYTGVVFESKQTVNGFTFFLDTPSGQIKCFSREPVVEMGLYKIRGEFSSDGSIFFIDRCENMDGQC